MKYEFRISGVEKPWTIENVPEGRDTPIYRLDDLKRDCGVTDEDVPMLRRIYRELLKEGDGAYKVFNRLRNEGKEEDIKLWRTVSNYIIGCWEGAEKREDFFGNFLGENIRCQEDGDYTYYLTALGNETYRFQTPSKSEIVNKARLKRWFGNNFQGKCPNTCYVIGDINEGLLSELEEILSRRKIDIEFLKE